ncbi:hypothetical protein, partial [Pseudomonas aeruginosa]
MRGANGRIAKRWGSYFAVCSAVISIGLSLGLT